MEPIALDADAVAQLSVFEPDELRQIAGGVVDAVTGLLEELGEVLQAIEVAVREADQAGAAAALRSAQALWPPTRAAIEQLGSG